MPERSRSTTRAEAIRAPAREAKAAGSPPSARTAAGSSEMPTGGHGASSAFDASATSTPARSAAATMAAMASARRGASLLSTAARGSWTVTGTRPRSPASSHAAQAASMARSALAGSMKCAAGIHASIPDATNSSRVNVARRSRRALAPRSRGRIPGWVALSCTPRIPCDAAHTNAAAGSPSGATVTASGNCVLAPMRAA